jgi:N4-gp56 family major capsid protein
MANAYTSTATGSLGGTIGSAGLVQKAYDALIKFALRGEPLIRAIADVAPTNQTIPGSTVVLQRYADMTAQKATLSETVDPDSVAIATPTTVTITLNEYGNAVLKTRALKLFSLTDVDPGIANLVAWNMADSIDQVAQDVLRVGTNVYYAGATATNTVTLTAAATFASSNARKTVAKMRGNNAHYRKANLFWAGIHPYVSHDLRAETGAGSWRQPHEYQGNDNIWAGEIGSYEGAFYVENSRMYNATDGAASAPVYRTLFAGAEAFSQAVAEEPHIVFGLKTDKMLRFTPVSWYGVLGFAIYRQESLYRVESGSSVV